MEKTSVKSKAVTLALAHIDAWSKHDWEKSAKSIASDVHVTINTTQPIMGPIETTGSEDYMKGLKNFGQAFKPGTAKIISSTGDDKNAMVMVSVDSDMGHGPLKLIGSRLYMFDDNSKIKSEKVIFYMIPE